MERNEQVRIVQEAVKLIAEGKRLLESVQSENPGQPLAFRDHWFSTHSAGRELGHTLASLNHIREAAPHG